MKINSAPLFQSILLVASVALLGACAHRGEPEDAGSTATATPARSGLSARSKEEISEAVHPIYFDFNSSELNATSKQMLDDNIIVFKRWPKMQILVAGHTDEEGDLTYNLNLGGARASAVREYLVDHGIALDRIIIGSEGEHAPDNHEDSPAEAHSERRTNFILYWEAPKA